MVEPLDEAMIDCLSKEINHEMMQAKIEQFRPKELPKKIDMQIDVHVFVSKPVESITVTLPNA